MINIGSTNFLINVPSLPKKRFEHYSTRLFDEWEESIQKILILPDYSISLEIEEGSIKGGGKVAITLGALYFGIGSYGDFISGLETIHGQIKSVNNVLFKSAKSPFGCSDVNATARKSGGAVTDLRRLFNKVQRGVLTADEAMTEVKILFGKEGESAPDFMNELQSQLKNAPNYPEQLTLDDEGWEECVEEKPKRRKRAPRPTPLSQEYRIEIWRESKKDKKHVKFTKL